MTCSRFSRAENQRSTMPTTLKWMPSSIAPSPLSTTVPSLSPHSRALNVPRWSCSRASRKSFTWPTPAARSSVKRTFYRPRSCSNCQAFNATSSNKFAYVLFLSSACSFFFFFFFCSTVLLLNMALFKLSSISIYIHFTVNIFEIFFVLFLNSHCYFIETIKKSCLFVIYNKSR